jgi:signal transduction histidine kinase
MTRRALISILAVAFLAVVLFAIPLAVLMRNQIQDDETLELEHAATQVSVSVSRATLNGGRLPDFPLIERSTRLAVYDSSGHKRAGDGPDLIESRLRRALSGDPATVHGGGIAVAVPLRRHGEIRGLVRAASTPAHFQGRVWRAWAALLLVGLGVAGIIFAVALWQSRRLSRPLIKLAENSRRLGEGDFTVRNAPTGVAEIDSVGRAFDQAAEQLGSVLARERAFSADASHQLRTPLTGLRLTLERAQQPEADTNALLDEAISEVDRLDASIEELLVLARDTHSDRAAISMVEVLDSAAERWSERFVQHGRRLQVRCDTDVPRVAISRAAVDHILDALLDNGLRHGAGTVSIHSRTVESGVAVDCEDEGDGIIADPAMIFARRENAGSNNGHGIGLALARRLADAEGARLLLVRGTPHPLFSLIMHS